MKKKTLAEWREARVGMTQFKLAVKSGVSLSVVTGVEKRNSSPRVDTAIKLAEALGVGVDDIAWPVKGDKSSKSA